MSAKVQQSKYGRPRKEGLVNRSASFNKLTEDGKLLINGKTYLNTYQYNKYWSRKRYVRPNGTRLVEGVDFYLHKDGRVVDGTPTGEDAQ